MLTDSVKIATGAIAATGTISAVAPAQSPWAFIVTSIIGLLASTLSHVVLNLITKPKNGNQNQNTTNG